MADARTPGKNGPGSLVPEAPEAEEIGFSGVIERIIFHNVENGYAVLRVRPDSKEAGRGGIPTELSCVGTLLHPQEGLRLRFSGKFIRNPRFGRQFQFSSAMEQVPASEAGLIAYLASGLIKGMGPDLAQRVVETFGKDTMRILDEEPERLAEIRGIGKKNITGIVESWREHRGVSELMQFLQLNDISPAYGVRIFKEYGARALDVIRENPYRLAMDVRGIGFVTADKIAAKLGIPQDSPLRVQGAVLYVLQEASERGNVFLPYGIMEQRLEAMGIGKNVREAVATLEQDSRIVVDSEPLVLRDGSGTREERAVYLANFYNCETKTAYYLERLKQRPANVSFEDGQAQIERVLASQEHVLARAQVEALHMAARSKVMVLTGGPGTGKTTIIKAIISLYEAKTSRIFLAAPTGRAAKRMSEATGMEARTLHRLLEYNPTLNAFIRNEDEPLACDLLIVDEASMMDATLFYYLMKAVPTGCVVIFVGDIHQLPSVGPGSVLADIIASGRVPVTELDQIFRQSAQSAIVANAHAINHGHLPEMTAPWVKATDFYFLEELDMELAAGDIVDLVCREIPSVFKFAPLRDIQFLTPMHKGEVGTERMNALLQQALNPGVNDRPLPGVPRQKLPSSRVEIRRGETIFRCGDKVMQVKNNYDKEIFNGDVGTITGIDRERRILTAEFDGRSVQYEAAELEELVLAYAISIHKSQGSEYPVVVLPLFMQHSVMLQRNLVYTAITRGKKLVVIVGDPRALAMAVHNTRVQHRFTRLSWRLKSYDG